MENEFKIKNINIEQNKLRNVFFLCHGGLGDIIIMSAAIRFISNFYKTVYLFTSKKCIPNLKIIFCDINLEFIEYDTWYHVKNDDDKWPSVTSDWYITIMPYLRVINNKQYELFDWEKYIKNYPDLSNIKDKECAWHHWITWGRKEGRQCFYIDNKEYELFDWEKYVKIYTDLSNIKDKEHAWHHWTTSGKQEGREYYYMVNKEYDLFLSDIFISGSVFKYLNTYDSIKCRNKNEDFLLSNNINNSEYLKYIKLHKCKYIYPSPYYHLIKEFYSDINVDLSVYYEYFHIPSTERSLSLFKSISKYNIVFIHFVSSCGQMEIPDNEWTHVYNNDYLIINPDKNHYTGLYYSKKNKEKYELANIFLNLLVVDYIDVILNARDIYVCDSCFANIVYPLRIRHKLKAQNIIIYDRFYPNDYHTLESPLII